MDDAAIRDILTRYRTIAVVGCSTNPVKDAHRVPRYMQEQGYRVIPVNPSAEEILGVRACPSLLDLLEAFEVVDIFRPSREVPLVVDQALRMTAKVIWMQSGIRHEEAARKAREAGVQVVQDRCMRTEHMRLLHHQL